MSKKTFLASTVIGILLMPLTETFYDQEGRNTELQKPFPQTARKRAEGHLLHENKRTGEEVLYSYRVMSDTTVHVRQGRGTSAPTVTLPRLVALTLSEKIEEAFPVDSTRRSNLEIAYEDRSVSVGFFRQMDLLLLGGLALVVAGLGGLALVLWRRLSEERQRRAALAQARRHQAKGQEKERRRLAREIHDGPVQDLHGLHMQLAASSEGDGSIENGMMRVTQALRVACADLRPPALKEFGLAAALRSFTDRFEKRYPDAEVTLQLEAGGGSALPEETGLALFRIAQEAMNNTVQHASSKIPCHLKVHLNCENRMLRLDVRDDGDGFEMPRRFEKLVEQGHFGLLGMAERAEAVGGTLDISSSSEGTRVTARIPQSEACPAEFRQEDLIP